MTYSEPEIIYSNIYKGLFIKRNNRFTAEVNIDGKAEMVHVKNTGRLRELLLPGAEVTLQKQDSDVRKTKYDLISVYSPDMKWVNIDSLAPNELMKRYLSGLDYDLVRPEYSYGNSRIDFYMEKNGEKYLTEVKGCTLTDDPKSGIGLFPDAPTERGVKHLKELAKAAEEGCHCTIAFVIMMNGIHAVVPNDRTQPEFGKALTEAVRSGVHVMCCRCHAEAGSIRITDVTDDTGRYR